MNKQSSDSKQIPFRCEGVIDMTTEVVTVQTIDCNGITEGECVLRKRLSSRRWVISGTKFLLLLWLLLLGSVLGGAYGAIHNQLSYTVSPEYFTEYKFQQIGINAPEKTGFREGAAVVGILSTWWVGAIAAAFLGIIGMIHSEKAMFSRVLRSLLVVLLSAAVVGMLGLVAGLFGLGNVVNELQSTPVRLGAAFYTVGIMHNCNYLGGVVGIILGIFDLYKK
jgi:hypothetical protein